MEQNLNQTLSLEEKTRLEHCELVIETGLNTFVAVGKALLEIKENNLYKNEFDTFENYCQSKWNLSARHSNRLIQASNVIANLGPMGLESEQIINNERKARILAKFVPEIQRLILKDLQESGLSENLTASFLESYSNAYIEADKKIREGKAEPLFSFQSESEMIAYAKTFIKPEIIEKTIEVIKEVQVIDEKLLNEKNQEISNLKNKVDYENRQTGLLKNKFESTENELILLKSKIQSFDSQIKELNRLKAKETDFNNIQDALSQINDLEKKKNSLLNDSENLGKILKAFGDGKEFFNKNILYIGTLSINEGTKKALEKEVIEFLNIVDNWKFAMTQRFLESNNLLSVGG